MERSRFYLLPLILSGFCSISQAEQCQITSPLPVPVLLSGCTYSGSLPNNSTSYIQNTLSPTTTTQAFSVQIATVTDSLSLSYVSGTQCLRVTDGHVDGTGADCGSGAGGGGGYFVEPATVTFNLAKGVTASTLAVTGAAGASVTYGLAVGSMTASSTTIAGQFTAGSVIAGAVNVNSQFTSVATDTTSIRTSLNAVSVATGTLRTDLNAVSVATGTLSLNFPVSLSTNVTGVLPAANMVSTAAFVNSTQTWTAQQTFIKTVIVSTSIGAGGAGTTGTNGQVLTSGGPGAVVSWTTVSGAGDNLGNGVGTFGVATTTGGFTGGAGVSVTYGIAVGSMTASSATVAGQMTAGTYQGASLATCGDATHALSWGSGSFGCQEITVAPGTGDNLGNGTGSFGVATTTGGFTGAGGVSVTYGVAVGSMTASSATVAGQFTAGSVIAGDVNVNSQFSSVATDTTSLRASINTVSVATGTLRTAMDLRDNAIAVDTGTLRTSLNTVATDTTSIRTSLNSTAVSTGTLALNFPVSLSTNVVGVLPAANVVSTTAFINSTQTWTAQQTFNRTVVISTTIGLGGAGTIGTSGQVLTSAGTNATPTWTTPVALTSLSASNPILYNSGTGAFSATPISLSTGVVGILPAANMVSTTSFINSTQTITAQWTHVNTVVVSTTIGLGGAGTTGSSGQFLTSAGTAGTPTWNDVNKSTYTWTAQQTLTYTTVISSSIGAGTVGATGTNGQVLTSGGPGAAVSWTTIAGSGDMVLASTQTSTGQKTFTATVVISTTIGLGSAGTTGTAGQFLSSNGPGSIPTWITASGTGDAVLASTQTWSGRELWNSPERSTFTVAPAFSGLTAGHLVIDGSGIITSTPTFTPNTLDTLTNKTIDAEGTGNVITIPFTIMYKGGLCQAGTGSTGGTASLGFSYYSSSGPTATCFNSSSTVVGVANFIDGSTTTVQDHFTLPSDFTGNIDLALVWFSTLTANQVAWEARTACISSGTLAFPTFNAYDTINSGPSATAKAYTRNSKTSMTITGCTASSEFYFEIARNGSNPTTDTMISPAYLVSAMFTMRRAL